MAKRERRTFTKECKEQMVQLYMNGKPRKDIIQDYSLTAYGEINALTEITECLQDIFTHFSKMSRPIDLRYVKKLEKAYNEIRGKN